MDEHLTEFERARAIRISENNRQMQSMGILLLVEQIAVALKRKAAPKAPTTLADKAAKAPTRRSRRVAGRKAELPWDLAHMHLAPHR